MKLSVDGVHKCDRFVSFVQTVAQNVCRGTSSSRCLEVQTFCCGTGVLEKAVHLDLRRKEGLHPLRR